MNAFADWLFSALFGWMGSAANGAWNALVNASGGISSFFSTYWLLFLLAVIIAGTVLDYAVWLVRWRPYLVWRSWLTRRLRRRRMQRSAQDLEHSDMDEQARGALAEWVSTPEEGYPLAYEPVFNEGQQAGGYQPDLSGYPPEHYYAPQGYGQGYIPQTSYPDQQQQAYDLQQPAEPLWEPRQTAWMDPVPSPLPDTVYQPLSGFQDQPLIDYAAPPEQPYYASLYGDGQNEFNNPPAFDGNNAYISSGIAQEQPQISRTGENGRRRRSDRKQRPMARRFFDDIRGRIGRGEDEETMLDGLPSSVRPEDAFHEAVYPKGYHYQDPGNGSAPEGRQ